MWTHRNASSFYVCFSHWRALRLHTWPKAVKQCISDAELHVCVCHCLQLVGVAVGSSPRQARVYDTATGNVIVTLDEAAAAAAAAAAASVGIGSSSAAGAANAAGSGTGSGEMMRGAASACFSPSGRPSLE